MSDAYEQFIAEKLASGMVVEDGDCLRWTGACINGHPAMNKALVRRVLWEKKHGPIPAGKILRCTCELKRCINLDHCEVSTYRKVAKECGAQGLMSGPTRSAKIAAAKRSGRQAKVSQDDVRVIRDSTEPGTVLAERYGVSEATISKYRLGHCRREFTANPWQGLGA